MAVFKEHAPLQIALNEQLVQAETIRNGVGATQPAQPRTAPPVELSPDQKKLVNQVFNLDQHAQDLILKHLKPLKDGEKKEKTMELLKQLYELIKIGGGLHIKYENSPTSDPKSPNEVLKKLRGNCEELSILFVAAAKYLNADMSVIGLMDMTLALKSGFPQLLHQRHTIALNMGDEKYVIDFTFKEIDFNSKEKKASSRVSSFSESDISRLYHDKVGQGMTVDSVSEIAIAKTLPEMAAVHFKQKAAVYHGQFLHNIPGKMEKEVEALDTILTLTPVDSKLRADAAQKCLFIADAAYPPFQDPSKKGSWDRPKGEEYVRKALSIESTNPAAHARLGALYLDEGNDSLAVLEFNSALASDPTDAAVRYNLALSLVNLKRFEEAEPQFNAIPSKLDSQYRSIGFDIYKGLKNYHKLLDFSKSVLVKDPYSGAAYQNKISALSELSKESTGDDAKRYRDQAQSAARAALHILPSSDPATRDIREWLRDFSK